MEVTTLDLQQTVIEQIQYSRPIIKKLRVSPQWMVENTKWRSCFGFRYVGSVETETNIQTFPNVTQLPPISLHKHSIIWKNWYRPFQTFPLFVAKHQKFGKVWKQTS